MTITMHSTRSQNITDIKQFITATKHLAFTATNKKETYQWIEGILKQTRYQKLPRPDKSTIRRYLEKVTNYSVPHIDRLVRRFVTTGCLTLTVYRRNSFPRTYTDQDIVLLAQVDEEHDNLSGPATAKILRDEWRVFSRAEFENVSGISPAHIYNLRKLRLYRETNRCFQKTNPIQVAIGERRKPEPNGQPGFLRVDSVHTGDTRQGEHGCYFINLVDEVTQWEVVLCVEAVSERYLKAALQGALALLPFVVNNFHTDNGSEYINYTVAKLLNKIHCGLTKSRPRRSNDNALVESKNGHVIRKHFGHSHLPRAAALPVQIYCLKWFNPYLAYHRPCGFAKEVVVNKYGKIKKTYPHQGYMTPYAKLKSLPKAKQYLKPGITFERLDKQAYALSHTQFAEKMNQAKQKLFKTIYV